MRVVGTRLILALSLAVAGSAAVAAAAAAGRSVVSLDPDWRFMQGDVAGASAARFDDNDWQRLSVPHSFRGAAGQEANPYRGAGWYRRTLTLPAARTGQRSFLEFDGAALTTDVWLNGTKVGRHEGGFARFRFDVTAHVKPGQNLLAVRVDSSKQADVAPLGGDYSLYGGLYRSVRLVTTADVHVDMQDYGGSGVYFNASNITPHRATLSWVVRVSNQRATKAAVSVVVRLRDAGGKVVATVTRPVELAPNAVTPVALDASLAQPQLWQGVARPYLYTSEVALVQKSATLDEVKVPVGIRSVQIDADKGVLLNGKPYGVHGVNIHQTILPGKGAGVLDADIAADYRILGELGVTGLRFSHYQHQQHGYDLADRKGYLVYTELPMTSEVGSSEEYQANMAQQLRELIRQNYNHPSVFVWGLGNEIYKVDEVSARLLSAMHKLAREEDASRPTVYANCCAPVDGPQAMHTDVLGSNVYYGWYDGEFTDLGPWLDKNRTMRPGTPLSISEYGAGASILHQQDPPQRPKPTDKIHPEQYQTLYHEAAWTQLAARPWLWSKFIWVGIDFPSAGRNEGDTPGFNDKGLVTFDRKVRKDAYYWYQANWAAKPMVHITSRRHTQRTEAQAEVKVYSNQPTATLRVNGVDMGTQEVTGRIARWKIKLAPGANRIDAQAGAVSDIVRWHLLPK